MMQPIDDSTLSYRIAVVSCLLAIVWLLLLIYDRVRLTYPIVMTVRENSVHTPAPHDSDNAA